VYAEAIGRSCSPARHCLEPRIAASAAASVLAAAAAAAAVAAAAVAAAAAAAHSHAYASRRRSAASHAASAAAAAAAYTFARRGEGVCCPLQAAFEVLLVQSKHTARGWEGEGGWRQRLLGCCRGLDLQAHGAQGGAVCKREHDQVVMVCDGALFSGPKEELHVKEHTVKEGKVGV